MMTRKTLLLSLGLLVVFGVSVWGGYALRTRRSAVAVTEQPGWCCIMAERQCVVHKDLETCRAAGGASYNWHQAACQAACQPPVRRSRPAIPATP